MQHHHHHHHHILLPNAAATDLCLQWVRPTCCPGNSAGPASAPQLGSSVPAADVRSAAAAPHAAHGRPSAAASEQLPAPEPGGRAGQFVQWKTIYIPHRQCYTTVKYVPDIYQPLHFADTCSADEPLAGLQLDQWQHYPADHAPREHLAHPHSQPGPNVSPSSNGSEFNITQPEVGCLI